MDGEPKHWELAEYVKEYYGSSSLPERKNLEFLIGLRNKIEHRHLPHLDATLYGECQAALFNFESLLVQEFGNKAALADQLGIVLQFSQVFPDEGARAVRTALRAAAVPVTEYIERFRVGLPPATLGSMRYSYSVFLVPRVANRASAADAAVQFIKVDEASREELERLQRLNVLIKEKRSPIANLNLHKPGDVVAALARQLSFRFNQHHHTRAWKHFAVRPAGSVAKRDTTDFRYCVYDVAHRDYVYTDAWVEKLAIELADAGEFKVVTGQSPKSK